jgi:uncharacterized protein with gpF-like domain
MMKIKTIYKPLKPIYPNLGIELAYRRKIRKLIDAMQASIDWWLTARYREHESTIVGDSALTDLQDEIKDLKQQWLKNFDEGAENLAKWFSKNNKDYAGNTMKKILKDAGIAVEVNYSPAAKMAYKAVLSDNVGLIKSIAQQHLASVESMVMQSVSTGRDLGTLTKELKKRYVITTKRAALIARDQNNKATAVLTKNLQEELGITHAIWRHSTAGKHPRPEHVKANNETYDIKKGMYLEGKWTWPGVEINCRCISVPLIAGYNS